jgi:ABC-type glycerol-3-phosphate transport system substrate-binding protein
MWVLAVGAVLTLALAACGSDGADGASSADGESPTGEEDAGGTSGTTTLDVLHWEPGGPEYWEAAEAAFEEAHPEIDLRFETVPFDRYFEVQGPYITSSNGPDVMANNAGIELFDRRAAYIPLNDRIEGGALDQLVSYAGACVGFDASQECYGVPFSYQGNAMYFNKEVLKEAGLDPEAPPRTWEEFGEACDAVAEIGKTCLAHGMTGVFPAYWNFPEIARNFLSEADIRSLLAGDIAWTDEKLSTTLQYMADLSTSGWTTENTVSISMLPDGAGIFESGDAAFAGTIISDAVNWDSFGEILGQENLGVMMWPTIEPEAPLADNFSGIEGSVYGITKWSDKADAGWTFVSWLAGADNAELWVELARGVPLNGTVDESSFPDSEAYRTIQTMIKDPTLHAGVMLSGQEADALSRGWQQVTLGQITVEDWAAQMQEALERSSKGDDA